MKLDSIEVEPGERGFIEEVEIKWQSRPTAKLVKPHEISIIGRTSSPGFVYCTID